MPLLHVLSWNLFHGRDAPPDRALRRKAWRLSGRSLDNGVYLGVNRSLEREFAALLCDGEWNVALLQETPPSWSRLLGERCGARPTRYLTARNQLGWLTGWIARRRPDLLGSWEGGANVTLARGGWSPLPGSERTLLLSPWRERGLSERRRMGLARLRHVDGRELCVANLHATERSRELTERELRRAAAQASSWAGDTPLVFGGDFNLRPRDSAVFRELEEDFGLGPATAPDAIDHLLVRGLAVERPPRRWPPERRDVEVRRRGERRLVRLSDHAPVDAVFRFGAHVP